MVAGSGHRPAHRGVSELAQEGGSRAEEPPGTLSGATHRSGRTDIHLHHSGNHGYVGGNTSCAVPPFTSFVRVTTGRCWGAADSQQPHLPAVASTALRRAAHGQRTCTGLLCPEPPTSAVKPTNQAHPTKGSSS